MSKKTRYMLKQNISFFKNRLRYNHYRLWASISDNIIVFESYGGSQYSDSVRAIYEELITDERFSSFYFVWAFSNPENHKELLSNPHTILVRKGTKEYRKYYATARYWINNVTVADYLKPSKNQTYIETWHGIPLKRLGCDIETESDPRQSKKHMHRRYHAKGKKISYFPSPSDYYTEKIMSAFDIPEKRKSIFINTGLPRNDSLFHYTEDSIVALKQKYGIPEDKKIILYTPTWRDSSQDNTGHFSLENFPDLDKLMEELGDNYFLLFRAHHQIGSCQKFNHPCILDVGQAENINDLYVMSDLMITDYSSTLFDYSNLGRPMIFHMYDLEEYQNKIRGFYFSLDELPGPITKDTKELVTVIKTADTAQTYSDKYTAFNKKFHTFESGNAAKNVIDKCLETTPHKPTLRERTVRFIKKNTNRMHLVYQMFTYNVLGFFRTHGLFHNNNSLRLARLKNIHKGERCFLIGNGPSLTGDDLNLLQEEYTFGTNMVYKIFDTTDWRPTYHCISDTIYASKLGMELSEKVKAPLFTTEKTYRRMRKKPVDTSYVHTIQSERYRVRGNVQSYCMVKATVLSLAAEMAFHMGFKEIYLLGVDCTNPHGKGGHFTDNYTTKEVAQTDINRIKTRMNAQSLTTKQIGEHIIDRSMEVYAYLDTYAKQHNIKIYNATRGGNLEIFPRVKLEDVLEEKN